VHDHTRDRALQAGRLLVANPLLPDPNFDRTVVLLLAYDPDGGTAGVVLNRPGEGPVAVPWPRWEGLAAAPAVLFVGGPVDRTTVICLASPTDVTHLSAGGVPRPGWVPVSPEIGTIDHGSANAFRHVRMFAGYAGWAAGQVEHEIDAGAWWVVDATPEDAFCADPGRLWKRVLRRQAGSLALVASYPGDPSNN